MRTRTKPHPDQLSFKKSATKDSKGNSPMNRKPTDLKTALTKVGEKSSMHSINKDLEFGNTMVGINSWKGEDSMDSSRFGSEHIRK